MGSTQPPESLTAYKVASVAFVILSILVFSFRLDILIPGLPNSSEREHIGPLLMTVPSFLLAGGQLLIGGFTIFTTIPAVSKGAFKIRMWKSMAIGGYLTFLFSLTYVAYPYHGPVYYAAFVGYSLTAILFEVGWALFTILSAGWAIRRLSGCKWKHALFAAGLSLLIIVVSAS
ncbi:MAG TPA: hypothetical protein VMS77_03700 [Conexivisphaerales archaeon]|nr:hypothetical protein [Conexivisphaerales archaeon]